MICVAKLPAFPPVGTRCFYKNEALRLEGWGRIVEPRHPVDGAEIPILTPWVGTLVGPQSAGQAALDMLAPGTGALPGEECYRVVPAILLWVEKIEVLAAASETTPKPEELNVTTSESRVQMTSFYGPYGPPCDRNPGWECSTCGKTTFDCDRPSRCDSCGRSAR